jgi:hypothetical protein
VLFFLLLSESPSIVGSLVVCQGLSSRLPIIVGDLQ